MKKCVFAGSFDPITTGHEEIIAKCSNLFDEVVVAVCINVNKKAMFSEETRVGFIEKVCQKYSNVKVLSHEGLLVDLLKSVDAVYNVRGLRNGKDFDYENEMNWINADLMPNIITIYVPCSVENIKVSSSVVRELLAFNKDVSSYVPKEIVDCLNCDI